MAHHSDPSDRREIDDGELATILVYRSLLEIRSLAGSVRRNPGTQPEEVLDEIRFLSDLCHNMPGMSPRRRTWRRGRPVSSFQEAYRKRPMIWTWNTASPKGQAWILDHVERAAVRWTPPPPLPKPKTEPDPLTWWQRAGVGPWPVRTPRGLTPLPPQARVLKALSTEDICVIYAEAGRLRLGLGGGGPWLPAHLAPDGTHYLVPDPADYYWPEPGGRIWWQCTALLTMSDGEQVSTIVAVMPETFAALASTVPRRRQRRLVHVARAVNRDISRWERDHKDACGPQTCGYTPEPEEATE